MFCTEDLIHRICYKQKKDSWGSDHHPMTYIIDEELKPYRKITNKITTKRTDWKMFEAIMEKNLMLFSSKEYLMKNHIEKYDLLSDTILKAAEEASGKINKNKPHNNKKTNLNKRKNPVEWWGEDCKEVVKVRKDKLNKFKESMDIQDYIEFKKARAIATKTINQKKRDNFKKFIESINRYTNISYVWKKIRVLKKSSKTIEWTK